VAQVSRSRKDIVRPCKFWVGLGCSQSLDRWNCLRQLRSDLFCACQFEIPSPKSGNVILPDEIVNVSKTVSIGVAAIRAITLPILRTGKVSAGQRFCELVAVTQGSQSIGGNVTRVNQIGVHVVDRV
jgi:hypothetical protein